MSKILVTGGAGFLGSHLCDRLVQRGDEVICVDNFFTGQKRNITHLLKNPLFELIRHDIVEPLAVEVDQIYNLACPASPVHYQHNPIKTIKTSTVGMVNMLGLAKRVGARLLQTSTSEVYGNPAVHPQPETYWGNVNPIGTRSCYDEGKRVAETLCMDYHRQNHVDIRIARIFNSILANETVLLFNNKHIHTESIEKYVDSHLASRLDPNPPRVLIPTFDPRSCRTRLAEASAVTKHRCRTDCYELSLRYGRNVKVTGDHSVFTRGQNGRPTAIPVRQLSVGDYVAIPAKLPVVEQNRQRVELGEALLRSLPDTELWDYAVRATTLQKVITERRNEIIKIIEKSRRFNAERQRNAYTCAYNKYRRRSLLPLYVLKRLRISVPKEGKIRVYKSGAHIWLPATINVTPDLLWLIGLFIAEGTSHFQKGKSAFISLCSDEHLLKRAQKILEALGCHVVYRPAYDNKGPSIFAHSKLLYFLFDHVLDILPDKQFPAWIMQLPLSKIKHVLEGYREGDGTHSGKKIGSELCFNTTSKNLADQLTYTLLRFGIVASVGKYNTTFRKRYENRRFPFYRITICALDNFDILSWDSKVQQTLNAKRTGDIVWSKIRSIKPVARSAYVYDFTVPGSENFIAGNGIFCHNTYGPRMHPADGRVVSNFIMQALEEAPLTVYGDGSHTRSFCYVDDMVEALTRLMDQEKETGPVNLGNPEETSMRELARLIIKLTRSRSPISRHPLPADDPQKRRPDITKAGQIINWRPGTSLKAGLQKTIAYFKSLP